VHIGALKVSLEDNEGNEWSLAVSSEENVRYEGDIGMSWI
jgi:hypothetical protein